MTMARAFKVKLNAICFSITKSVRQESSLVEKNRSNRQDGRLVIATAAHVLVHFRFGDLMVQAQDAQNQVLDQLKKEQPVAVIAAAHRAVHW